MPILTGVGMILIWYAICLSMSQEQRFLLPAPHEVARAFFEKGSALWNAALNTGLGALLGFGSAVALSFVMALILSLSPARSRELLSLPDDPADDADHRDGPHPHPLGRPGT